MEPPMRSAPLWDKYRSELQEYLQLPYVKTAVAKAYKELYGRTDFPDDLFAFFDLNITRRSALLVVLDKINHKPPCLVKKPADLKALKTQLEAATRVRVASSSESSLSSSSSLPLPPTLSSPNIPSAMPSPATTSPGQREPSAPPSPAVLAASAPAAPPTPAAPTLPITSVLIVSEIDKDKLFGNSNNWTQLNKVWQLDRNQHVQFLHCAGLTDSVLQVLDEKRRTDAGYFIIYVGYAEASSVLEVSSSSPHSLPFAAPTRIRGPLPDAQHIDSYTHAQDAFSYGIQASSEVPGLALSSLVPDGAWNTIEEPAIGDAAAQSSPGCDCRCFSVIRRASQPSWWLAALLPPRNQFRLPYPSALNRFGSFIMGTAEGLLPSMCTIELHPGKADAVVPVINEAYKILCEARGRSLVTSLLLFDSWRLVIHAPRFFLRVIDGKVKARQISSIGGSYIMFIRPTTAEDSKSKKLLEAMSPPRERDCCRCGTQLPERISDHNCMPAAAAPPAEAPPTVNRGREREQSSTSWVSSLFNSVIGSRESDFAAEFRTYLQNASDRVDLSILDTWWSKGWDNSNKNKDKDTLCTEIGEMLSIATKIFPDLHILVVCYVALRINSVIEFVRLSNYYKWQKESMWTALMTALQEWGSSRGDAWLYSLLANQLNYDLYLRFLPQHSLEMYPGLARYAVSLITLVLKKEWRFESDSFVDITDSVYRDQVVQIVKGMKRVIAPHWESVAFCICRRSRYITPAHVGELIGPKVLAIQWNYADIGKLLDELSRKHLWSLQPYWELCNELHPGPEVSLPLVSPLLRAYCVNENEWAKRDSYKGFSTAISQYLTAMQGDTFNRLTWSFIIAHPETASSPHIVTRLANYPTDSQGLIRLVEGFLSKPSSAHLRIPFLHIVLQSRRASAVLWMLLMCPQFSAACASFAQEPARLDELIVNVPAVDSQKDWSAIRHAEQERSEHTQQPFYVALSDRVAVALLTRQPPTAAELPYLLEVSAKNPCCCMQRFWLHAMNRLIELLKPCSFDVPLSLSTIQTIPVGVPAASAAYARLCEHMRLLRARIDQKEFVAADVKPIVTFLASRVPAAFQLAPSNAHFNVERLTRKFVAYREAVAALQRTFTWLGTTLQGTRDSDQCVQPALPDAHDRNLTLRKLKENRRILIARLSAVLENKDQGDVVDEALQLLSRPNAPTDRHWILEFGQKQKFLCTPHDVDFTVFSTAVNLLFRRQMTLKVDNRDLTHSSFPPLSTRVSLTEKSPDLRVDLMYFREKSQLIWNRARKQIGMSSIHDVRTCINRTRVLVLELLDSGGQTLAWLKSQAADVNELLHLKDELENTAKFLRLKYNPQDLEQHILAGSEILHFQQFAPDLHNVTDGCTALYKLEPSAEMRGALEEISNLSMTLREAANYREKLREELKMELPRARIFTMLKEAKPVVDFLRQVCNPTLDPAKARVAHQEFDELCRVRQEAMASHRFIVDDIRCIQRTWDILSPLLWTHGEPTMTSFLAHVGKLSAESSDEEWEVKLRILRIAVDHLPQIKRLFNPSATLDINMLVPLVEEYKKTAIYRSSISAQKKRLTLDVPKQEHHDIRNDISTLFMGNRASTERAFDLLTDVENLLASSQVFLTDHLRPDEVELVEGFRRMNLLAHDWHNLRCKAKLCSYTDLAEEQDLNERGTMDVALFEKAVADLTDALGVWNAKLAKAKKDQPRLALLNPLETAQFLSTLSVYSPSPAAFLPFVRACFPDATGMYGKVVFTRKAKHYDVTWYETVTGDTPSAFGVAFATQSHMLITRGPRGTGLVAVHSTGARFITISWQTGDSGHAESVSMEGPVVGVENNLEFTHLDNRTAVLQNGPFPRTVKLAWNEDITTHGFGTAEEFFAALPPPTGGSCDLIEVPRTGGRSAITGAALTALGTYLDASIFCPDGIQSPVDALQQAGDEKCELHFSLHGVSLRLCEAANARALAVSRMQPLERAVTLLNTLQSSVTLSDLEVPEVCQKIIEVHDSMDLDAQHFALLRANLGVPIPIACRFICDAETTKEEITNFLALASQKPALTFGIFGVNRLPLAPRKELLNCCTERFVQKISDGSLLILLFTEPQGREAFAFIPSEPPVAKALPGLVQLPFRAVLPKDRFMYWLTEPGVGKTYAIEKRLSALRSTCTTLSVDICEDFAVSSLISDLETKCSAKDFSGLAMFWNISAFAPLALISELLLDIWYFQSIRDRATGRMFCIPPCALRYLFLELHRAPVDELRYAGKFPETDEAVLKSLPVLNYATRVSLTPDELRSYDGAEARLVAALYSSDVSWEGARDAYEAVEDFSAARTNAVLHSLGPIAELPDDAEACAQLTHDQLVEFARRSAVCLAKATPALRQRGLDPGALPDVSRVLAPQLCLATPRRTRMMFIHLLAIRLTWLKNYIDSAFTLSSGIAPASGQIPSPHEMMHAWLLEAGQFCTFELRTSSADDPYAYISRQRSGDNAIAKALAFITSRQTYSIPPLLRSNALWLDNLGIKQWTANQAEQWLEYSVPGLARKLARKEEWNGERVWSLVHSGIAAARGYFVDNVNLDTAIDTLSTHYAQLRIELAATFHMQKTDRMASLLQSCNYHLTNDLFLKIIALNERLEAKANVVMTGLTGVGKTEILRVLAYILNADKPEMPAPLHKLRRAFYKTEAERRRRTARLNGTAPPPETLSLVEQHQYLEGALGDVCEKANISTEALLQLIKKVALTRPPVQQQQLQEPLLKSALPGAPEERPPPQDSIPIVAAALIACARKLFRKTLLSVVQDKQPRLFRMKTTPESTPVIDTIDEVMAFATEIASLTRIQVFTSLLMHQNYRVSQLREEVDRVKQLAIAHPRVQFVVFIDEVNTAPALGVINSIFVDRSLLGLPDNIFWVAAMNPQKNKDYDVRAAPLSMQQLQVQHGALRPPQEAEFVHSMLTATMSSTKEEREKFALCICEGQNALRNQSESKISPSLRDVSRAVQLREFFLTRGRWLLDKDVAVVSAKDQAMIFALACTYLFRLPADKRGEFEQRIAKQIVPQYAASNPIRRLINAQTLALFDRSIKPKGVASTIALRENLFSIVVAVSALIPLLIKGPAGCAKTLSFSIAMDNFREGVYPGVRICDPIRYQVSTLTTDTEIEGVYIRALDLLRDTPSDPNIARRCVVLLDEANLADERASPLKVLHYHLDHATVATVMLANEFLDAAKMNRMMLLQQSNPQQEDLRLLATGTLLDQRHVPESELRPIWAICDAYMELEKQGALSNDFSIPLSRLFNTRDFTFVLRHLRRECGTQLAIQPSSLLKALQRNIGGLPPKDLRRLVENFFAAMRKQLPGHSQWDDKKISLLPVSELVAESLQDFLQPGEDANTSCFRYIMLLDPTDTEASVALLRSLNLLEGIEVVSVSTSPGEPTEQQKATALLKIKRAMQKGETILLLNSASIVTCLYDLFNRYFDRVPGPPDSDGKPTSNYYVRISIGAVSRLCEVHPRFKIIVHMSRSQLRQTPGPLLSRFEKYLLSVEQILLEDLPPWVCTKEFGPVVYEAANDFVKRNHEANGQLLYGVVPKETVASLIKSLPPSERAEITPAFGVPTCIRRTDGPAEFTTSRLLQPATDASTLIRATTRALNFRLLQLARPEELFFCRQLPDAYLEQYLLHQEHFSAIRFLNHLVEKTNAFYAGQETAQPSSRWILFCRSSPILLSIDRLQGMLTERLGPSVSCFELPNLEKALAKPLEAMEGSVPLYICVAELGRYSTAELNDKRDALANFTEKEAEGKAPIVVMLLHFPAHRQLGSLYDAIWLNNFDFLYVDSIGLSLEGNDAKRDVRAWVATAFGLQRCHSPEDVKADLESLFDELLPECIQDMPFQRLFASQLSKFNLSPAVLGIYTAPANRVKIVQEAILGKPVLRNALLSSFSRLWTTELLYQVVERACNEIKRGESTDLLAIVSSSLRILLRSMVLKLLFSVLRSFTIQRIMTVEPSSPEEDLLKAAIYLIQPPYDRQDSDPTLGSQEFALPPPRTVFYQLIASRIEELILEVKLKQPTLSASNFHTVLTRRCLHAHESLGPVLQKIAESAELQQAFKLDFITHTIKAPSGTEEFGLAIYEDMMRKAGASRRVEAWSACVDVLALFSYRQQATDPSFAALACQYSAPLARLRSSWLREKLPTLPSPVATNDADSMEYAQRCLTQVLTAMLRDLASTQAVVNRNQVEQDMQSWCEAMLQLRSNARWWPFSTSSGQHSPGVQYGVMLGFLLVVIHRRLAPADALKVLYESYDQVKRTYALLPVGIPDLVRLVHHMCGDNNNAKRSVTVELLGNVLPLALVPASTRTSMTEDLRSFAVLCTDAPGKDKNSDLRAIGEGDQRQVLLSAETVTWLWAMIWRKAAEMHENLLIIVDEVLTTHCEYARTERYEPRMHLLPAKSVAGMEEATQHSTMLETAIMLCLLNDYRPPSPPVAVPTKCELLDKLMGADILAQPSSRLRRAALAAAALCETAEYLSSGSCNMQADERIIKLDRLIARSPPLRVLCAPLNALETLLSYLRADVAFRFLKEGLPRLVQLPAPLRQEWTIAGGEEMSGSLSAVFRFMLPGSDHPLAARYSAVKAALTQPAAQLLAFLRANTTTEPARLCTRMLVALAAFYEHSDLGHPCNSLMELINSNSLQGVLVTEPPAAPEPWRRRLPDMEVNAYRLLAMGPNAAAAHLFDQQVALDTRKQDVLAYIFTEAGMKQEETLSARAVLVNALAVALGCPPDRNHLYACIFYTAAGAVASRDPLPLNRKPAPGSVEHRVYWDCGFKMPFPNEGLVDAARVLGNNKRHRMALGSLCWLGFSLATLIGGDLAQQRTVTHALADPARMYHLLNFLNNREDVAHIRDTLVQHWKAMMKRIESDSPGLIANHYMNEMLLQFYNVVTEQPHQALISVPEANQLEPYEKAWQDLVFNVIDRELDQTRKVYLDFAARNGAAMKRVTEAVQARVDQVLPPAVSPDVLGAQLVNAPAERFPILAEVLAVARVSQLLVEVPKMLQFYRELSHLLTHNRLWKRERFSDPVAKVVAELCGEMESDTVRAENFKRHYDQFKRACENIQAAFAVLPENGANQVFYECQPITVEITPDSPVNSLLVMQDENGETHSQILLLVANIIKRQSEIFSRDSLIKALEIKYANFPLLDVSSTLQSLRSITECLDNDPRLLQINAIDLTQIALCHTTDPRRPVMPLSLPRDALILDAAETFVVSHLLHGRCSFQDPNGDSQVKIIVRTAEGIVMGKESSEPLFTTVGLLHRMLERLMSDGAYDHPLGELEQVLELHLKNHNSPDALSSMVKWLNDLLLAIIRTYETGEKINWEKLPMKELVAARTHLPLFRNESPCPFSRRFLFKHLRHLGKLVLTHAESASCFGPQEVLPPDVSEHVSLIEWRQYKQLLVGVLKAAEMQLKQEAVPKLTSRLLANINEMELAAALSSVPEELLKELPGNNDAIIELLILLSDVIAEATKSNAATFKLPLQSRAPSSAACNEFLAKLEHSVDPRFLTSLKITSDRLRALQERASGSAALPLLPLLLAHEDDSVRAALTDLVPRSACIAHISSLQRHYFAMSIKVIDRQRQAAARNEYTELVPAILESAQTLPRDEERAAKPAAHQLPVIDLSDIVEEAPAAAPQLPDFPEPIEAMHRPEKPRLQLVPLLQSCAPPIIGIVLYLIFSSIVFALVVMLPLVFVQHQRRLKRLVGIKPATLLPLPPTDPPTPPPPSI